MDREQYLLTCLMEEAGEVIQAASKAMRFGTHEVYPKTAETNIARLARELNDLRAVIEMVESCVLEKEPFFMDNVMNGEHRQEKKKKVEKYMGYSRNLGVLDHA